MLGYTWVVFEKFSVFFSRDGYLFSTKFLYFSHEMGTFFQETFCIFCARWVPFCRNFLVYIPKGGCHLRRIFLYFPARWVSFKRIFAVFGFTEGRFPVSHISISPLSVNTSLIVGNLEVKRDLPGKMKFDFDSSRYAVFFESLHERCARSRK